MDEISRKVKDNDLEHVTYRSRALRQSDKLLGAGVAVDFQAHGDFNNFRLFPGSHIFSSRSAILRSDRCSILSNTTAASALMLW
jgi:hypothetical protein